MKQTRMMAFFCAIFFMGVGPSDGIYLTRPAILKLNQRIPKGEKVIILTFDDGPSDFTTPKILQILKEKKIRATFFVLGERAKQNTKLLKRVSAGGHEIGNHSYSHPVLSKISLEGIRSEIGKTSETIENIIEKKLRWFRPPYGEVNDDVKYVAYENQLMIIRWSVDPEDWKDQHPDKLIAHIKNKAGNGSIVLLHDNHMRTVHALPSIIDHLHGEGYIFLTLGEWYQLVKKKG